MKKVLCLTFSFLLLFVTVSFAQDKTPSEQKKAQTVPVSSVTTVQNPAEKLNRGIVNIITAPIEIAKQVDLQWKQNAQESKPISAGVLKGFVRGLFYTACRAGSGMWDIVTFPLKKPANYESIMKPEFVLDK